MNLLVFLLGVLLVVIAILDALITILWVDGRAGPITSRLSTSLWRAFRAAFPERHLPLSFAGPSILTTTLIVWICLLWAGWVTMFSADPNALISTREPGNADLSGRIYFVAYFMSTVGNGDFYPNGSSWQIITSCMALSGIVMVTIAVSYVLSVIPIVSKQRAFAAQVHDLGDSAEKFVVSGWDGEKFRRMDMQLESLTSQLSLLSDQHLGYPILHHFHAASPSKGTAPALAILDDALTLMSFGVSKDARPDPAVLTAARASVWRFLEAVSGNIKPAPEAPGPPDLRCLRDAGIPTVTDEEFAETLRHFRDRRRLMLGLVRDGSHSWPPRHVQSAP